MILANAAPGKTGRRMNPKAVTVLDLKDRRTASAFLQGMNAGIEQVAPKIWADADSVLHCRDTLKLWLEEAGYDQEKIQQATVTGATAARKVMASRELHRLENPRIRGASRDKKKRTRLDDLRSLARIAVVGEPDPVQRRNHLKQWLASREGKELTRRESAVAATAEARRSRRIFAIEPQPRIGGSAPPLARAIAADSKTVETALGRPMMSLERRELIRGLVATGNFASEEEPLDPFERRKLLRLNQRKLK